VFVSLRIQHAMRMRHIVIISQTARLKKIVYKTRFDFLYKFFKNKFIILRQSERNMMKNTYWSPCAVPFRYSYRALMKLEFSRHIFDKYSNIKFHENPSSRSRIVPCGRTNRQTVMKKLMSLFAILRKHYSFSAPFPFLGQKFEEKMKYCISFWIEDVGEIPKTY
jgi:hypothetical protein